MKLIIAGLIACLSSVSSGQIGQIPSLEEHQGKILLHVDGKPFPMLGGQLMNSTSFSEDLTASAFSRLKAFHLNTAIAPVSWQAIEPVENEYDFSMVDRLVAQARNQELKLVLLWFGSWKNGRSGYVPGWVISDLDRFPRMERKNGVRLEVISNLSEEASQADAKAFAAFMKHLREIDGDENTVLMVQIENEMGLLGDSRNRSARANEVFAKPVPEKLMNYLSEHKDSLMPEMKELWQKAGAKTSGTWTEVFGEGLGADEIFMAWYYGRYVNRIALAGKAEHPIPHYVNAWTVNPDKPDPGKHPSGGPVARMMDVWKAAAPDIDLLAVDCYQNFKTKIVNFAREDNPLFIPEACALWRGDRWSAPQKAFYAIGEAQAIGFAPFGIDHEHYGKDHPIGVAYKALSQLMPLILEHYGQGRIRAFYKEGEETREEIKFEKYRCRIKYAAEVEHPYGLIIQTGEDQFIVAGNGAQVIFQSNLKNRQGVSVTEVEEGEIVDGQWRRLRLLAGDEVPGQGTQGVALPPLAYRLLHKRTNMSMQRLNLYLHPPRKDGKADAAQDQNAPKDGVFD